MKITKLITIDSSTNKSGIGYYENGNFINYELLDFSYDKVLLSRYKKMTLGIWELLEKYDPDIVYIEEMVVVKNAHTQRFLTRLQGAICMWCDLHNCEFNTIRPTSWRKQLNFSQGSKVKRDQLKQQSIQYVKDNYGLAVNDDIADALCIGSAVLKMFEN